MNKEVLKFIDQIIAKVIKADISALDVEVEGIKVRAERSHCGAGAEVNMIADTLTQSHAEQQQKKPAVVERTDEKIVKSPIVGTFYLTPGPNERPFVKAGDSVVKGQSVCIIEAMKIMNEIESDFDGIVKEVLVSSGSLVEYGQPLIVIG